MARRAFYPEIESLRGVAALVVVAHHCFIVPIVTVLQFPAHPLTLNSADDFFSFFAAFALPGQSAVPLFFVISGFVLGIQLSHDPVRAAIEWPGYAVRRAFRILPAMWISIALGATIFFLLHRPVDLSTLFDNATFQSSNLNPPTWTLRVELVLSLLLPPLAVMVAQTGMIGIVINIALQAFLWWRTADADPTLQFAAFFHLGLLVPTVGKEMITWLVRWPKIFGALAAISLFAFCSPFAYSLFFHPGLYTEQLFAVALPSFLLVSYAAFGIGAFKTALQAAPVRFMGKISYSLYVLHFPIMMLFMTCEIDWLKPYPRIGGEFLLFALTIVATVPLAYLSFRYVERPCIGMGHAVADKLTARLRALRIVPPEEASPIIGLGEEVQ